MPSAASPPPDTEAALRDTYPAIKNLKEGPGKKEQKFDKFGTEFSSKVTSLNEFWNNNSELLTSAAAGIASLDNKTIDNAITGFSETVKVVINGLDALGDIHPFVKAAVVAFKLVVTLDLTRRENNQKVLAVKVEMQRMMCTLFQLRQIKDPDEILPDGAALENPIQLLMVEIARKIKKCGSDCDVYLKKSFIAKTLKSKIYEGRLAEYATTFMDYKDQLDKALTVHITRGVDAANEKLDTQLFKLESMEEKLNMLMSIFRRLDTPREKEVMEFIQVNGGPNAVVGDKDLVETLVKKSGETLANLADKVRSGGKSELDSVREKLQKEVSEDLKVVFEQNFTRFDRKLEIQNRNILDAMEKQEQHIISAISTGNHDKIKDTDLHNLWRVMMRELKEWKGSVKARHFVLALRDYFTNQFSVSTPHPNDFTIQVPSPDIDFTQANHFMRLSLVSQPVIHGDHWALQYINVAHLTSILEAIDDDGTGFISVKEANTFANERPKGWGLLHWIAFWAKGWETSLADYKNRIILILQEMDRLHHDMLLENQGLVDLYLLDEAIQSIHLIVRSIRVAEEYNSISPELRNITLEYTKAEEERLKHNLEEIGYDLDSPSTVVLVTGPGRIERYLFPLLYLVLKRHLEVFHYSQKHIVDNNEFWRMSASLNSVFDVVRQRIDSVGAICKQARMDLGAHLEVFSLRMFHDYNSHNLETVYGYGSEPSLFITWKDTSTTKDETIGNAIIEAPETSSPLFSSGSLGHITGTEELNEWPRHTFEMDPITGRMDGFWTGHLWIAKGEDPAPYLSLGLTQLKIILDPNDNQTLGGYAVTYMAKQDVHGRRRTVDGVDEFDILLSFNFDSSSSTRLVGKFITKDETLVGSWLSHARKDEARKAYDNHPFSLQPPLLDQPMITNTTMNTDSIDSPVDADMPPDQSNLVRFVFRRSPAEVAGFWPLPDEETYTDAKSRWSFLRAAVLHLVRTRLWSWSTFHAWCVDRRRFLNYYTTDQLEGYGFSLPNSLGPDELAVYHDLRYRLPPSNINPCVASALWTLQRASFHYTRYCDSCHKYVFDIDFTCLTCIDPGMSNTFDLCAQCMEKPAERDGFTHTVDHTLIKCSRYTHPYALAWQITEARSMTERLKKVFTEASTSSNKDNQIEQSKKRPELLCGYCAKPVTVPCWACITCVPDFLICNDCEKKGASVSGNDPEKKKSEPEEKKHRTDHPLLRLHNMLTDKFEREKVDPTMARINDLGEKLTDLDTRLAKLENVIEEKLSSFESLLKKVILQSNEQ